jgi:putative intracellular protease/amidase
LLSALHDSTGFQKALEANDGPASSMASDWPYAGYRLGVFSTGEEPQLEGPSGLGGFVRFYPVTALAEAGAHVDTFANWHSNVVVVRELVTGQQPMSAEEYRDVLVSQLNSLALAHA